MLRHPYQRNKLMVRGSGGSDRRKRKNEEERGERKKEEEKVGLGGDLSPPLELYVATADDVDAVELMFNILWYCTNERITDGWAKERTNG